MNYSILAFFEKKSIVTILHDSNVQILKDKEIQKINQIWKQYSKNTNLYNGELCNFNDFKIDDTNMIITTSKTNYAAYLARQSNKINSNIHQKIKPLTVGAVAVTSDYKIIIGKRSNDLVAPNKITPLPQGFITPYKKSQINPISILIDKLNKELNISEQYIENLVPGGLVKDKFYGHLMLIFFIYLKNINSNQIFELWKESSMKVLNESIWFIDCDKNIVTEFLFSQFDNLTGDAVGSLILFGKYNFGNTWYQKVLNQLVDYINPAILEITQE
tara:strand:+ start:491 stop:1312 length:822 start_codon:yes stop_codon:yes gene_type:complete